MPRPGKKKTAQQAAPPTWPCVQKQPGSVQEYDLSKGSLERSTLTLPTRHDKIGGEAPQWRFCIKVGGFPMINRHRPGRVRAMGVFWLASALCLLVSSLLVGASAPSAQPSAPSGQVVRVFYPLQAGLTQQDDRGLYSGYTYEYLMRIAQLTGWKYEFTVVKATNESLQDGLEAVKTGELDLVGAMSYTPQLVEDYLYSADPYGETSFTLVTAQENTALNDRTVLDYPQLRVALVEKAQNQNQLFSAYCAEKGITYEAVYGQSNAQCRELVKNGQADALISKDIVGSTGYKTILKFGSQPFYFATTKENSQLMDQLNWARSAIESATPGLEESLYSKYFSRPFANGLSLTADEQAFLQQTPAIRVAVPIGLAPVQDYDEKTGQFSGIMVEVLETISQKSGLPLELVPVQSKAHAQEQIQAGAVDMIAGLPYSFAAPQELEEAGLLLTSPVLSMPIVRVTNPTVPFRETETLVYENIRMFEGASNILYADDTKNILEQVEKGTYSQAYASGYVAQYYLERGSFQGVTLVPTPFPNYDICLGVGRGEDLRLVSILEQAISALTPAEVEHIVYQNTSYAHQVGMVEIVMRNPVPFALGGIVVLALISLLLLLLFIKTRHLNRLICAERSRYKVQAQTDGLTQVYNNTTFRSLLGEYLSQKQEVPQGALMILDVDSFKEVNDTYGHLEGDEVLRTLAAGLKKVFREGDLIGRLGGDEFAVLMKGVGEEGTMEERCKELGNRILSAENQHKITLSMGAVLFAGNLDGEELLRQADEALYEVKKSGRNGYRICVFRDTQART